MVRPLRLEFPGALYHVTSRGNAREDVYRDDVDRQRFLQLLAREVHQQGWLCHAFCLMSNHFHLLIETPHGCLSRGMQRLNSAYTQGFNRRHNRVGHLFQGRYHSIVVERDSYLLELARYIVLNPVRAGMVRAVDEWPWSSYRATVGLVAAPDWLQVDWVLGMFGRSRSLARRAYGRFVLAGVDAGSPWGDLRGQMWLGSRGFRGEVEKLVDVEPTSEISQIQRIPSRPTKKEVLAEVCRVFQADMSQVLQRRHQPAYQAAAYLLRRLANLSLGEVAGLFGISRSRVSHIQRVVERNNLSDPLQEILNKLGVRS